MAVVPYVVVSDIHFFHRRTPTTHIIDAFWKWLLEHEKVISTCQLFIFAGDIFDKFIPSHFPEVAAVNQFFFRFGKWLAARNITLIALEGTSTHDRKQFTYLLPVLEGSGVNVKYYQTVCVDVINGMSILFVPDNWSNDQNVTLSDAKTALAEARLVQTDIAIIHGFVEYQLPMMKHGALDQRGFEALVKTRIHIGHVHLPSQNGKVDAQGSFDRVSHSEEHGKGGVAVVNGKRIRLTNRNAYPYVTLSLKETDPAIFLKLIGTKVKQMNHIGWLRIQADRRHPVFDRFPEISTLFPTIKLERQYTGKVASQKVVEDTVDVSDLSTDALLDNIRDKYPSVSQDALALIRGSLEDICV